MWGTRYGRQGKTIWAETGLEQECHWSCFWSREFDPPAPRNGPAHLFVHWSGGLGALPARQRRAFPNRRVAECSVGEHANSSIDVAVIARLGQGET